MHTVQFLNHLVERHQVWTYLLIFLVTIVEGEIIGISSGILILLGALNVWIVFPALFLGGMAKTLLGYSIGLFLQKKFNGNRFFNYVERKVLTFMPRFKEKPFWSIFVSKFIIGLNHLVIIFSGYKKISFKTFMKAEVLSTAIWVPEMIFLGYFFSYAAFHISKRLSEFTLIIVLFIIGFFIFDKMISLLYEVFENI